MPYLSSYRGDYLGSYRGDPGIFGSIWKGIKGAATGFLKGGPIGAVGGALGGVLGRKAVQAPTPRMPAGPTGLVQMPQRPPILIGRPTGGFPSKAAVAAGAALTCPGGYHPAKDQARAKTPCVRNRRMNPANPRALRRAIRRQDSFVRLARKALKGSGYTITSRSRARRPVSIRESGPGSVTVR